MKREPWQRRLERVGLSQVELAQLLGIHKDTISKQLTGKDALKPYVANFIRAWERLPQWARDEMWQLHASVEDETAATDGVRIPSYLELLDQDARQRVTAEIANKATRLVLDSDIVPGRVDVGRLIAEQQSVGRGSRLGSVSAGRIQAGGQHVPSEAEAEARMRHLDRMAKIVFVPPSTTPATALEHVDVALSGVASIVELAEQDPANPNPDPAPPWPGGLGSCLGVLEGYAALLDNVRQHGIAVRLTELAARVEHNASIHMAIMTTATKLSRAYREVVQPSRKAPRAATKQKHRV